MFVRLDFVTEYGIAALEDNISCVRSGCHENCKTNYFGTGLRLIFPQHNTVFVLVRPTNETTKNLNLETR